MRHLFILALLLLAPLALRAQPADCPTAPADGPTIPLALDLAGRPGVPAGTTGQAYVAVPAGQPGYACQSTRPPPTDVLHGEPGDVLHGPPSRDLLRGPGTPQVRVEQP
ncbi:MAG: hypothetical protein P4L71_03600 [Acetobacteraceae bacterium]|nr:hypothetical protein [Acetobacteraceae bacterium]